MRRGLVLLLIFLCSCGPSPLEPTVAPPPEPTVTPSPEPTVAPPPDFEAEERAVHSALVRQNPIGYEAGSPIVLREHTLTTGSMVEGALENADYLPGSLVDSFQARNAESFALDPDQALEQAYTLMPEEDWTEIFGQGGGAGARLAAKYPDASGVIALSGVGFNENADQALALMDWRCGDLCGMGGLFLLVKEDGSWKVQESLLEWMS